MDNKEDNIRILLLLMAQYATLVFCFAGLYGYCYTLDASSFTLNSLSFFNVVYFSFLSITTIGFSDFYPSSIVVKLLYCIEVSTGMFFILLFLTAVFDKIKFNWRDKYCTFLQALVP